MRSPLEGIKVLDLSRVLAAPFCAMLLARVRTHSGGLTRAAFLSARNDTLKARTARRTDGPPVRAGKPFARAVRM